MNVKMVSRLRRLYKFEEENEYMGKNKRVNDYAPVVSICVATYQHVNYIEQCINGILLQQTDFNYEIIIGEDHSTDGTREICIDYANKYPSKIRLFLRDRATSLYYEDGKFIARFNGIWCRMSARGRYIAICEGDDYWTDPLKLQKQVGFLDENEDYILTCGGFISCYKRDVKPIIKEGIVPHDRESEKGFTFLLEDLTKDYMTKTLTALFRNEKSLWGELAGYRYNRDIHIYYHLLKNGKGFYFKEIFGVYNIHEGGVFSLRSDFDRLRDHYYLYKELFDENRDEYPRTMYLRICLDVINYKISLLKANKSVDLFALFKESLKLVKTRSDVVYFIKSLIPKQIRKLRHIF